MKHAYRLILFLKLFIVANTHTMNEQPHRESTTKHKNILWLKPSNRKKSIPMPYKDACHSSYIGILNSLSGKKNSKDAPIITNATKKEVKLFTTILKQPLLYQDSKIFPLKKRYESLTLAEKLAAPLLYAELLTAILPEEVLKLISRKYETLCRISTLMWVKAYDTKEAYFRYQSNLIFQQEVQKKLQDTMINELDELDQYIERILKNTTLLQTILLKMLCCEDLYHAYPVYIGPHRPGNAAFTRWKKNKEMNFMNQHLPIKTIKAPNQKGIDTSLYFNFMV